MEDAMQERIEPTGWQAVAPGAAPDIAFEFGNEPTAPRAARRILGQLPIGDQHLAECISLVASELVSNVVMHTNGGGCLRAWNNDPLRLEVQDHHPHLPVRPGDPDECGGRGLGIVDGIADGWGAQFDDRGKTLWVEFRRSAR